jgi:hypothetical protein
MTGGVSRGNADDEWTRNKSKSMSQAVNEPVKSRS